MTAPINFADLMQQSKGQLEPVPDGDYNFKVVDAQATQASTGSPMIKTKLEITDGPHVKRRIYWNATLTVDNPMALAIFFRNMANLGLNDAYFQSQPTMDQVASAMMNRTGRMTLSQRTWQGVARNEVKAILPPLAGVGGPVAPGTVTGPAIPSPSAGATPSGPAIPNPTAGPHVPTTPTVNTSSVTPTINTNPTPKDGPPAPPVPAF